MRGRRFGSRIKFQRLWKSFHAIWNAMNVFPVPVASVNKIRGVLLATRIQCPINGQILIIPSLEISPFVFERNGRKSVSPVVRLGKRHVPEFVRRRVAGEFLFCPLLHVDAVDSLPVGGVREPKFQFFGVLLRLSHPFGQWAVPRFGLNDGEFRIAINEHVIGNDWFATFSVAFEPSERDRIFPADLTPFDNTSASRH
jgi:hypothetical protein